VDVMEQKIKSAPRPRSRAMATAGKRR